MIYHVQPVQPEWRVYYWPRFIQSQFLLMFKDNNIVKTHDARHPTTNPQYWLGVTCFCLRGINHRLVPTGGSSCDLR